MTTVEWHNAEIPRDRWGRPMVLPPTGGKRAKRIAYRRVTTFVSVTDDMTGLMKWHGRQVALGMGQRPDLVLAAAAANPADKRALGDIADKAKEAAMSSAAADIGTALHSLTERIDRGLEVGHVPAEYRADLEAYKRATDGIEWRGIETFRVFDDWQVAGTADRIGVFPQKGDRLLIADIKTGSIDYAAHKIAMQLAMYSRAVPYDIATDKRGDDPGRIDPNIGVIIHLPAGKGECELIEVDIGRGWGGCQIARQIWNWRGAKDLTKPLVQAGPPPTWQSLTAAADTLDDVRLIWQRAKESNQLDAELKALLTRRANQIKEAS